MSITRTCRISGKEFIISDQEIALLEKLSPIIWWERFLIPLPTISPEERRRRKLQFKNYFTLFKRKDENWKMMISMFPEDTDRTIYSQPFWWGDTWNSLDYALDFDSSQTITNHIYSVIKNTPLPTLDNAYKYLENCEYINGNGFSKNCYFIFNGNHNENCLYGWSLFDSANILDSSYIRFSQNCSRSLHLWKCFNVHSSWNVSESRDSEYIFSCDWCRYILGCIWLKNQEYKVLNSPCTETEYQETLRKIRSDSVFRKSFELQVRELIKSVWIIQSVTTGSTNAEGDFCYDSKDVINSYNVGDSTNICHTYNSFWVTDTIGLDQWWENTNLTYESLDIGLNASNIYCSISCWNTALYNFYCTKCNGCSYVFWCSGLRNKSYCIFNKQYTKEEWESTVKSIVKQMRKEWTWGEFLDPKYAPFAYNESQAMDFMPLSRDEALRLSFRWSDREELPPERITKIIPWERLPENIREIPDDILNWAIKCPKTGKLFQIQPLELEMHRRFSTPIPRVHPIERIKMRLGWDRRVFDFDF